MLLGIGVEVFERKLALFVFLAIPAMVKERYASFDSGKGKEFEDGKLGLEDLVAYAKAKGEPKQTSGKQELYETIVNIYSK